MKKKLFTVFCYQCKRVQVDIQVYIQHTQFDEYFESKQAQPYIHQPRTVIARKRIKHEIMPERQKDGIYVCTYTSRYYFFKLFTYSTCRLVTHSL